MSYYKIDKCPLTIGEKWADGFLVTYPVSYRYNGGTIIDGEWYEGYEVVPPAVPDGYEIVSIHCGLQLNAHPPYATNMIRRIDGKKFKKRELETALVAMEEKS